MWSWFELDIFGFLLLWVMWFWSINSV